MAVFDARRTGRLAGATGQTTIEMPLGYGADGGALQDLLDQIDAPSWPIEFVAEDSVGRTGGRAEAAMYATAQDSVRPLAFRGGEEVSLNARLHRCVRG